jgi:hypothetical protein
MRHCVGSYADRVALGVSRIYSMRRFGVPVATIEIRPAYAADDVASIEQICGPSNTRPMPDALVAAYAWFAAIRQAGAFPASRAEAARLNLDAWCAFWRPYWARMGAHAPIMPTVGAHTAGALLRAASVVMLEGE